MRLVGQTKLYKPGSSLEVVVEGSGRWLYGWYEDNPPEGSQRVDYDCDVFKDLMLAKLKRVPGWRKVRRDELMETLEGLSPPEVAAMALRYPEKPEGPDPRDGDPSVIAALHAIPNRGAYYQTYSVFELIMKEIKALVFERNPDFTHKLLVAFDEWVGDSKWRAQFECLPDPTPKMISSAGELIFLLAQTARPDYACLKSDTELLYAPPTPLEGHALYEVNSPYVAEIKLDGRNPLVHHPLQKMRHRYMLAIRSACGTGKTRFILNLIKLQSRFYKRVLYVVVRVAQATTMTTSFDGADLGFINYQDPRLSKSHVRIMLVDRLVLCVNSIARIKEAKPYDLVVVDESESVLSQLSWVGGNGKKRWDAMSAFARVVSSAHHVVYMDGNLATKSYEYMRSIRPEGEHELIINKARGFVKRGMFVYNPLQSLEWYASIRRKLLAGENVFIATNDKTKTGNRVYAFVRRFLEPEDVLYLTGDSKQKSLDVAKEWVVKRCVIITPVITVGLDFNIVDHFNSVFVFSTPRSCNVKNVQQMMQRVRHTKEVHYHYNKEGGSGARLTAYSSILQREALDRLRHERRQEVLHSFFSDMSGKNKEEATAMEALLDRVEVMENPYEYTSCPVQTRLHYMNKAETLSSNLEHCKMFLHLCTEHGLKVQGVFGELSRAEEGAVTAALEAALSVCDRAKEKALLNHSTPRPNKLGTPEDEQLHTLRNALMKPRGANFSVDMVVEVMKHHLTKNLNKQVHVDNMVKAITKHPMEFKNSKTNSELGIRIKGLHQIYNHLKKNGYDLAEGGEIPLRVINQLRFGNDIKITWGRLQAGDGDAGSLAYRITRATLLNLYGQKIALSKKTRTVRVYPGLTCAAKRAKYRMREKLQQAGLWVEEEHAEMTKAELAACYSVFAAQKYLVRPVVIPPVSKLVRLAVDRVGARSGVLLYTQLQMFLPSS